MEFLNFGSSLAALAIVGTVFGFVVRGWGSIKAFFNTIYGYFVTHIKIEDEATSQIILAYLIKTKKRSFLGQRVFGGRYESLRDGKFGHIPYESFGLNRIMFYSGWWPLWFNVTIEKNEKEIVIWGSRDKPTAKTSLSYFRGTVDVEKILREASVERNDIYWNNDIGNVKKRFFIKRIPDANVDGLNKYSAGTALAWYYEGVYRLLNHKPEDLGRQSGDSDNKLPTEVLYFPPHVKKMIHEISQWRQLQQWYKERSIPWKRGWLLYGMPGTGKTALTRAIAEELDLPLFVYSLGRLINDDLEKSWAQMQAHIPCIALFEDFDNVFHGRQNVYGRPNLADIVITTSTQNQDKKDQSTLSAGQLSFDCLLNCLDGVDKSNGIFTIITTNHIDHIDPAIGQPRRKQDGTTEVVSTRPGRIDKAIELGYMSTECKKQLARRIFRDDDRAYVQMLEQIDRDQYDETPAQFQERCAQMALDNLWRRQNGEV